MTLRSLRLLMVDRPYELKALKAKPICRLIDAMVWGVIEKDPSMVKMRQEETRRLAEEYGAVDVTCPNLS